MSNTENDTKWDILQVKLQERNVCKVFRAFRKNGIEPVLIKGYAVARYYPEDVGRSSVDIDLAFDPDQFDAVNEFLSTNPIGAVGIDIHNGLRHHDTLSWQELFSRSQLIDVNGEDIRVLSDEDHLRVLCVHWLTDGGENKKRLWDIYYAVSKRPENFDWDKCLGVVSEKRRNWVIYTIGIAHHYLKLDISDLPFKEKAERVPPWLLREVKRHWDMDLPIVPLNATLHDKDQFFRQVKKRFPPNPIYSTISMEGSLDARTRIFYQAGNLLMRISLAWRGFLRSVVFRLRQRK